MYTYICIHVRKSMYENICIYINIHISNQMCVYMYLCTDTYTRIHVCVSIDMCICTNSYLH
jgi:hypothetical protein